MVERGLTARGFLVVRGEAGTREELPGLIASHAKDVDLLVMGGGDGTLNAAARGVLDSGLPLAIVPTGTANDLARSLDIPADIDAALDIVAAGHTRRIDVGMVNDLPFSNVASIGLSVELTRELTRDLKRRFGKLGYPIAAWRVFWKARPFRAKIVSGRTKTRSLTLQVAIGAGRYYGGGNLIEKSASNDDGRLVLYSLEPARAWRVILMLRALRRGEHGAWDEIRSLRGESFEIRTRRPRPVNADGEIVSATPARFTILPGAIEVFAPPKSG